MEPEKKKKRIIASLIVIGLFLITSILNYFTGNEKIFRKSKKSISSIISPEEIKFKQKFITGDKDAEYKIGLIKIEGEITSYYEGYRQKGLSEIVKSALENLKQDEKVKGIILKINTPGGDIFEVEKIYEKIKEVKKSKPVVALLENIATSGGYYCAVATDKIISHPLTITGNIGAIIILYNVKELFEKKLGINMIVMKSGKHKDIGSPFRIMDIEEKKILQNLVDQAAKRFLDAVIENRKISNEKIKIISDGRIFTGSQAKEIGLIDEIGGLQKAVDIIKEMTKEKKLKVVEYYYKPNIFEILGFYRSEKLIFSKISKINTPVLKYLWMPEI
ncbi:MAG: signal peptide peptidase SppA [Candidatus Omnitrophica bacterium]|nr:signal peptide peptidase SppA [Candidatus Omnitrophota bacterium]MCM8809734.1 signal peptide peptidase SppA [Candidatus Omnitrophota bacterium]MCM8810614.1 signal peptide peptidase SppA [Candidatus Omnitrophota bacterium]